MSDRRQANLISPKRVCIQCGAEREYPKPGKKSQGAAMISVTPLLYRGGNRGNPVKAGAKVNICEPCFIRAIHSTVWRSHLWGALRDRLSEVYKRVKDGVQE